MIKKMINKEKFDLKNFVEHIEKCISWCISANLQCIKDTIKVS